MESVYKQLAEHLDKLPGTFPATDSGVELRILKRLFTPEEAHIAIHLSMMPAPASVIAQRMSTDEDSLAPMLLKMSHKGLIIRLERNGILHFMAAQFMVGIWEYHVNDLDEGLIKDVNEYLPYITKAQEQIPTQQLRVIPIAESVASDIEILPYERAEEIIKAQSKIVVADCICRKEHQMVGKGCGKPLTNCLVFGGAAFFYEGNGIGRSISHEEAIEILRQGIEADLVLQPGNAKKPASICMCCGCCCQVLKMLKRSDKPAEVACTSYYVVIDEDQCMACGACEEKCQMDAINIDDIARVDLDRCIGCGLCIPSCDVNAIQLKAKDAKSKWTPPANVLGIYKNMAKERGKR